MDLLIPSSPGGLPTLSLTTNSCWLPWGGLPCLSSALWCQYPKNVLTVCVNCRILCFMLCWLKLMWSCDCWSVAEWCILYHRKWCWVWSTQSTKSCATWCCTRDIELGSVNMCCIVSRNTQQPWSRYMTSQFHSGVYATGCVSFFLFLRMLT